MIRRRTAMALIVFATLCIGGCGVLEPPTDAKVMERFSENRVDFAEAVSLMTTEPRVSRIEAGANGGFEFDSPDGDVDSYRIEALQSFMRRGRVRRIEIISREPIKATFLMSGRYSKHHKELIYSRAPPAGVVVADTDLGMGADSDQQRQVYRALGDDWYLINRCC